MYILLKMYRISVYIHHKQNKIPMAKSKRPRISSRKQLFLKSNCARVVFSMVNTSPIISRENDYQKNHNDLIWREIAGMFTGLGRLKVS